MKMILDSPKYILGDQGQSVGSGEKARRKFSSTGGRASGYRLSPHHFQTVKRMLAPDWAQKKCFVLLCPIGEQLCDCPWVPEDEQSRASKRFYVKNQADI